jgi:hypothetical protein
MRPVRGRISRLSMIALVCLGTLGCASPGKLSPIEASSTSKSDKETWNEHDDLERELSLYSD